MLTSRAGQADLTFGTFGNNDLWYHDLNEFIYPVHASDIKSIDDNILLKINKLSDVASYEL